MAKPNDPFAPPTNTRGSATPGDAAKPQRGISAPSPARAVPATAGPATQRGPGAYGAPDFLSKAARPAPSSELPSQRTIELVQWSWAKVMPISDAAAALFYERLFTLDPSVRPLFKNDIAEQKKKLMQTLAVAVDGLNNLPKLVPVLQSLGVRHQGYMVAEHHYDVVGEALLWTLREGLGDAFSSDVETAWKEVYGLIADVMKKAAAEHVGRAAPGAGPSPAPARERPQRPPMSEPRAPAPQSVTEVMPPKKRQKGPLDEDADTLHYQTNPAHEALSSSGLGPDEHRAAPAAAASPQGIVIPWAGQDMVVNVHVKLDSPLVTVPAAAPVVAPAAPAALESTGPSGLVAGLAIGLLSIAASMATAILLAVGGPERAAAGAGAAADRASSSVASLATYAVPIIVTVLVLSAFTMGHILGRGRARGDAGGGQ